MTVRGNLPTGGGSYQPEQHEVRGVARNEQRLVISKIELLALKKLAIINAALAKTLSDHSAWMEQKALTSVLIDVINRAEIINATTPPSPEGTGR